VLLESTFEEDRKHSLMHGPYGESAGEPGGKKWRRAVDEKLRTATSVEQLLDDTLSVIPDEVLDRAPSPPPPTPEDGCSVHLATLPSRGGGFTAADPVVVAPTEALAA